jgi:hypothetical protein
VEKKDVDGAVFAKEGLYSLNDTEHKHDQDG